jgi:hypothetical protein
LIVADSSVLIPWAEGNRSPLTELVDVHLVRGTLRVAPVTITELASPRVLEPGILAIADALTVLPIEPGFWKRAGLMRGRCLAAGRRARLADALIAQACLDARLPLLTADRDFDVFRDVAGLELATPHD